MIATGGLGILCTILAPYRLVTLVFALGIIAILVYVRLNRHRLVVEAFMIRSLLQTRHGCPADVQVPSLDRDVRATALPDGVTRIQAEAWLDGVRAMGFVTGRDRGFQMDRLRRMAAGRLSEVWGSPALYSDVSYRSLDLTSVADKAVKNLEQPELELLEAYASGVTTAWETHGPPFECRFLSYHPEPWTPRDSLLVALLLFHGLSWNERSKRADAVIRHVFPNEVARFFLPSSVGDDQPIPKALDRFRRSAVTEEDFISVNPFLAGSNCWVQSKGDDAHLACDLHLPLSMPNTLYEIDVGWSDDNRVRGLIAVGLPVILTGTNGNLSWGITNLCANLTELTDGRDPDLPSVTQRREHIGLRGRPGINIETVSAGTAVLSSKPLLGNDVFVRWAGFDVRSCDLKFQRLVHVKHVNEGIAILDEADGIALNVLLADGSGHSAHLATGLIPRREPGALSVAHGYLSGAERPRIVDPPGGDLVSANDAAIPEDWSRIGYDLDPGYRARRIRNLMSTPRAGGAADPRAMQHDTSAELYRAYRDLAVQALNGRQDWVTSVLTDWDGTADIDSRAFSVLVRLREVLAKRVLAPYLASCLDKDPDFRFAFQSIDRTVLAILRSRNAALLPSGHEADGWEGFIAGCVDNVVDELTFGPKRGQIPTWGEVNVVGLHHPLQQIAPWSARLLSIAPVPQAGALHCVRTCVPGFGAVGRAVLRLGAIDGAEFTTPGGQSGHPLSRHYNNRHPGWSGDGTVRSRHSTKGCQFVLRSNHGAAGSSGERNMP